MRRSESGVGAWAPPTSTPPFRRLDAAQRLRAPPGDRRALFPDEARRAAACSRTAYGRRCRVNHAAATCCRMSTLVCVCGTAYTRRRVQHPEVGKIRLQTTCGMLAKALRLRM
jgi:hypothetical protein